MNFLVTGVAGFIGYHVANALLDRGDHVLGIDNLNDYYDPSLKKARLELLSKSGRFSFRQLDVSDREAIGALFDQEPSVDVIIHLAAQAGVRYARINPYSYVMTNLLGQVVMLENLRRLPHLKHFVYASSSSVYGANEKQPFSVDDRVDRPVSLYAATKRSGELIAESYAHLYHVPSTGLRFFTVYGPWGRPDMAAFLFTKAILEGSEITVFNHGNMRRDFTYIDDIVDGVLGAAAKPPERNNDRPPHRVYNLGNNRSENLMRFIQIIEEACGKKAIKVFQDKPADDVTETFADIEPARRDYGYQPRTTIDQGLPNFVDWYRAYYGK